MLKIIGLGITDWAKDMFNLFDAVVVAFSFVELAFELLPGLDGVQGLTVLRTFRLMRVFKLIRSWKALRNLLNTILACIYDEVSAAVVLCIIVLVFAMLGMELFGGVMLPAEDGDTRGNFDDIGWSIVTVFQVLTGENWNDILIATMVSVKGQAVPVIYYLSVIFVGDFMMLNLFLAILMDRFEGSLDEEGSSDGDKASDDDTLRVPYRNKRQRAAALAASRAKRIEDGGIEEVAQSPTEVASSDHYSCGIFAPNLGARRAAYRFISNNIVSNSILLFIVLSSITLAIDDPSLERCNTAGCTTFKDGLYYFDFVITIIFALEMAIKMFGFGILGIGLKKKTSTETACDGWWCFEVRNKLAYLQDAWNVLDAVVVAVSITSLIPGGGELRAFRMLRALRALRPLRAVQRLPGLKLVVNALIQALPGIANASLVCCLFLIIFAIVGLQQWRGALGYCTMDSTLNRTECTGTFVATGVRCVELLPTDELVASCLSNGTMGATLNATWDSFPTNYDNLGNSLITVFEVVSGEMWPEIMYLTIDAQGPGLPQKRDFNRGAALYFIAVNLICALLLINVFVGIIIHSYNTLKARQDGSALLTEGQKVWVETMKRVLASRIVKKPRRPTTKCARYRGILYDIVTHKAFDIFISLLICVNLGLLCVSVDGDDDLKQGVEYANVAFVIIFTLEAVLKIIGLGRRYFMSKWNQFDFFLVVVALIGVSAEASGADGAVKKIATIGRIFRVARAGRLVKMSTSMQIMLSTFITSIPQIGNVLGIILLLVFIYSVFGMHVFANIRRGAFLNDHANFDSFGASLETMFRATTGESYNGIMHDLMVQPPYCNPASPYGEDEAAGGNGTATHSEGGNCGAPAIAPIFFTSYILVVQFVMLNLLIAIILDQFGEKKWTEKQDAHPRWEQTKTLMVEE